MVQEKLYQTNVKMTNNPEVIIVHHSAVSRLKNTRQFAAIKSYHITQGWGDIGYHWLIEPNGYKACGRADNHEGAHTKSMNHRSIGICLAGNFDEELPTIEQIDALSELIADYRLPVRFHREYANKTCPGKLFKENMIKYFEMTELQIACIEAAIRANSAAWHALKGGDHQDEQKKLSEANDALRKILEQVKK